MTFIRRFTLEQQRRHSPRENDSNIEDTQATALYRYVNNMKKQYRYRPATTSRVVPRRLSRAEQFEGCPM
jgi:hypothetical protein